MNISDADPGSAAIASVSAANRAESSPAKLPEETFHLPPVDFNDSRDVQFDSVLNVTGGITREEYPYSTEEEGSEPRYSSSETDIPLPPSDEGGDTPRAVGGVGEDGEGQKDAVQEAIAEVSADFVSGNLSVSLSQHTLEATSSDKVE